MKIIVFLLLSVVCGISAGLSPDTQLIDASVKLSPNCRLRYLSKEIVDLYNTVGIPEASSYNIPFVNLEYTLGYYALDKISLSAEFNKRWEAYEGENRKSLLLNQPLLQQNHKEQIEDRQKQFPENIRKLKDLPLIVFKNKDNGFKKQGDELCTLVFNDIILRLILGEDCPITQDHLNKFHQEEGHYDLDAQEWLLEQGILQKQRNGHITDGPNSFFNFEIEKQKQRIEEVFGGHVETAMKNMKQDIKNIDEISKKRLETLQRRVFFATCAAGFTIIASIIFIWMYKKNYLTS